MEMETVTEKKEVKEGKEGKEESSKVEEAETAEYSVLHQPTEDVYSETNFSAARHADERRKVRLLQVGCAILSCVSLVLLVILIFFGLGSSSCANLESDSSTCSADACSALIPQYCPRCQYCPNGWLTLQRSCFFLSRTRLNWQESQKNCTIQGGSLAVIPNAAVQDYLSNKGKLQYWIGLRSQNGQWTWVNNASLTLNFWSVGVRPSQCAILQASTKQTAYNWVQADCSDEAYFICELQV